MYIYCTLSSDQKINFFEKRGKMQHLQKTIYLNGKANIANKQRITSPYGMTKITESQLVQLKTNVTFNRFVAAGHITWSKSDRDAEKATEDMKKKDKSAPITPESLKEDKKSAKIHSK